MTEAEAVIDFWLHETPPEKRFARDAALDAAIARRFGSLHRSLSQAVPEEWTADARSMLGAIIVLDQFSRNLFRDDPRAFAQDSAALTLAWQMVVKGWDMALSALERQFVYLPFEHAEDLAAADQSVALFAALEDAEALDYARRHHAVIVKFGRYPRRNKALGRESTKDEVKFLADHPEGF
ncbi:MAG TPA: DUF924 family protein [Sphingomonas sp.]|jgi:uncharacterized protein (DUF924 family)|nr:DUF924 family protein [Sphingomonas sp.]